MTRNTWTDSWLAIASVMSSMSLCDGSRVGAVITDCNNRIVATGYNGPPSSFDHKGLSCSSWCKRQQNRNDKTRSSSYGFDCPSIHAEANAFMFADRRDYDKGNLYVTSICCQDCAKLIANSGVKKVTCAVKEEDLDRTPKASVLFLLSNNIDVELVVSPYISNDKYKELQSIKDDVLFMRNKIGEYAVRRGI